MSTQWLCLIDNQQYGPFPWETLQQFVQDRRLAAEDRIRREDDQQWYFASQFSELFPQPTAAAPAPKPASPKPKAKSAKSARAKVATAKPAAARPAAAQPAPAKPAAAKPKVARQPVPVASHPVASQPIASVPTSTPVASVPMGIAVAAATTSASPLHDDTSPNHKNKSRQQTLVVGGLLGAIGLMIVIALVVFATTGGDGAAGQIAVDDTAPDVDGSGESSAAEANPAIATNTEANPADLEANPKASVQVEATAVSPILDDNAALLNETVNSVTTWRDASRQRAGLKGVVRIHVDAAWLETSPSSAGRVGVELHVKNMASDAPLTFGGWPTENVPPQQRIVLVDDAGRLLPVVERSTAASETSSIASGAVLKTRVYFETPAERDQNLKIAIPYAAIGRTGFIGYRIPNAMLKTGAPNSSATESASTTAANTPPVSAASTVVEAPVGKPDSIDDLKQSIEQSRSNPAARQANSPPRGKATKQSRPPNNSTEPASIDELRKAIEAGRSNAADS